MSAHFKAPAPGFLIYVIYTVLEPVYFWDLFLIYIYIYILYPSAQLAQTRWEGGTHP